jgi:translation initiation factor eIF-2B subunit beta
MGIVDPVLLTPSHPIPPTPSTLSGASYDLPEWQWDDSASSSNANGKKAASIKPLLIQAIQEVIEEVETVVENVAKNAGSHIHSTEIILTLGHSRTIEAFLKHAAKDRKFTVIIAETSPSLSGHSLAKALATPSLPSYPNPIPTLLIPDSNIYAFIPRCTKLLLPSSAVLSSGGSLTPSLGLLAATAAKANSVQVVVCAGQYKLTPSWGLSGVGGAGGDARDPGEVLAFGEGGRMGFSAKGGRGAKMGGLMSGEVEVVNPRWDYVGPELIDVFLTDQCVSLPCSNSIFLSRYKFLTRSSSVHLFPHQR